jgi:uncharacterized membrane protein
MMDSWGWPFMGIIPLLFLIGLIAVVVLLARSATGTQSRGQRRSPGIDVPEERYARGEI